MKFVFNTSAQRTSEMLTALAEAPCTEDTTIGDFVAMLGNRSFALIILIFSLPNSLPLPGIPGFSTITGIPILFIALQMMCGRKSIWLPRKIAQKHFSRKFFTHVLPKAVPIVRRIEKFLHPRLTFICENYGERFIGLLMAVMAFILSLPVFGGNFLPGFSISLLALALLEDDGLFGIFSIIFCIISLYFMYELVGLALSSIYHWIAG